MLEKRKKKGWWDIQIVIMVVMLNIEGVLEECILSE
jgi:hypothetical protein